MRRPLDFITLLAGALFDEVLLAGALFGGVLLAGALFGGTFLRTCRLTGFLDLDFANRKERAERCNLHFNALPCPTFLHRLPFSVVDVHFGILIIVKFKFYNLVLHEISAIPST